MAKKRVKNDFYPTPVELAFKITELVASLIDRPIKLVIEPSAGTGAFIRAAKKVWPDVPAAGVDINPEMKQHLYAAGADGVHIGDWCEAVSLGLAPGTLILGNPPFSLAQKHIAASNLALTKGDFNAMLLRMSFMGSRERVPFWSQFPARYLIPLVPRPKFIPGKSGDNAEYGVFIWQAGYTGTTELLPVLVWKER